MSEPMTQLDRIEALLVSIDKRMASGAAQAAAKQSSGGAVAPDADLDSQWGDEPIKKMPKEKYWQGDDFTGSTMSECPADFLEAFAKYKDACAYMGQKTGEETNDEKKLKYAGYDRTSAARARGWAKRIREGKVTQTKRDEWRKGSDLDDDGVPF